MIIRSKAPLRIGFAGGGTDVSPYCDIYGGSVLNATINRFVYCTIESTEDQIIMKSIDTGEEQEFQSTDFLEPDKILELHKGVYNFHSDLFNNLMLPKNFSIETDFFKKYIELLNIIGFESDAYLIDIGVPEDYYRAQAKLTEML